MADTKISALTAVTTPAAADELAVNQSAASKKLALDLLGRYLGKGQATRVVAASNASSRNQIAADYLCDGTADEVQINAAIADVAAFGGKVLLTEGTFTLAAPILLNDHGLILEGVGWGDPVGWTEDGYGTTLYPAGGFTGGALIVVATGTFASSTPCSACQIRNLMCDGAAGTTTPVGSGIDGIQFSGFTGLLQNVRTVFMSGDGVHVSGKTTASTWSTYETRIDGLLTSHNTGRGLFLDSYAEDMQIFGVVSYLNKGTGIEATGSSNQFFGVHTYDNGDGGGTDGTANFNLKIGSSNVRSKFVGCKFEHAEGQYGVRNEGWETVFSGCSFHNSGDAWGSPTTSAVTFQDTGDTVTQTDHRLLNGDAVQFSSITSTTGISINTTYYVVSRASNTFQVSASVGGSALPLTTNGSGTLVRGHGGNARGHLYNSGSMTVTGSKFGIKDSDFSIGSAIELSSGGGSCFIGANEFQTGNADTSGFWNGVAVFRNGAVLDTGSKGTTVGNAGATSTVGNVRAIEFVIDGGGSTITTGVKGDVRSQITGTIERASLLADQSGSIVVDIWKDTYANYPPTDADSITASAPPTISSATKSEDTTLTGWTTAVTAGDTLRFNVDSATTITRVTVILYIRESV